MLNPETTAECPYNKNHRFATNKLFWHLGRCKDKLKNQHLYRKCRFNPMHVHLEDEIDTHESICKDKIQHQKLISELKSSLINCKGEDKSTERSRSRQKRFVLEPWKRQPQVDSDPLFEECENCQKIMKLFMQKNTDQKHKILKLINKYKNLRQSTD